MPVIRLGEAAVRYDDEGSGDPILLLHGFPTTRLLWKRVAPLLVEAGFRVVAPDLVGYG
jgi:haloacetate dehalogenase